MMICERSLRYAIGSLSLLSLLLMPAASRAQGDPILIRPGFVQEGVEMDSGTCLSLDGIPGFPIDDIERCNVTNDQRILVSSKVNIASAVQTFSRGRLFKNITIEEGPESASNFVVVRFAGDFAYEGNLSVLQATGITIEPGFAQVVANFKVIDQPPVNADEGNVIGSRNILTERLDVDLVPLLEVDKRDAVRIKGSGSFDFAVSLERGRSYSIMIELECLTQIVQADRVECDFAYEAPIQQNPGLFLSPLTVTADDDSLERISGDLLRIQQRVDQIPTILANTDAILTDTNNILTEIATIIARLDSIGSELTAFRTAFDAADARAIAERQELNDLAKEVIRLLHVPTGNRTSDVQACSQGACDFPEQ